MIILCSVTECSLVETGYWYDTNATSFRRNNYISIDQIDDFISKRNNQSIFLTTYMYNTSDIDNAYLLSNLYFDFDSKDSFEDVRKDAIVVVSFLNTIMKIDMEDIWIYFSGNKGIHLMVPHQTLGIEPHKNLNLIYKTIATQTKKHTKHDTLDLVIYDNKRMFRVPGSIHEKTGLRKVPITADELWYYTEGQIKEIASKNRNLSFRSPKRNEFANKQYKYYIELWERNKKESSNIRTSGNLKYTPPCIQHLIDNGAEEGKRNNSIAVMASFKRNCGVQYNEALEFIKSWNTEKNHPATKDYEVERTVRSIYTGKASYGCSTIQLLTTCLEKECRLKSKAR